MWQIVFKSPFSQAWEVRLGDIDKEEGVGRSGGPRMEYLLTHFPTTEGGELEPGFNSFFALSKIHALPFIEACGGNMIGEVEGAGEEREGRLCSGFVYRELWEREKCTRIEATDQIHIFVLWAVWKVSLPQKSMNKTSDPDKMVQTAFSLCLPAKYKHKSWEKTQETTKKNSEMQKRKLNFPRLNGLAISDLTEDQPSSRLSRFPTKGSPDGLIPPPGQMRYHRHYWASLQHWPKGRGRGQDHPWQ